MEFEAITLRMGKAIDTYITRNNDLIIKKVEFRNVMWNCWILHSSKRKLYKLLICVFFLSGKI